MRIKRVGEALQLAIMVSLVNFTIGSVPVQDLFPFGESTADSKLAHNNGEVAGPITLQIPFPYFNTTYPNIFVSNNGGVMFGRRIFYSTFCGSISRESVMLTPFWANVNLEDGGDVFYRESREGSLLEKATRDIRTAFPELWYLNLGSLFIVTWDRVPRDLGYSSCDPKRDLRNTFQAILATDGTLSFVLFYYNVLEWTTDVPEAKGDCNGKGGTPAKVGFDEGNGVSFFELPGSCTRNVTHIVQDSNIGDPGKWVFRVDNAFQTAACDDQKFKTEKLKIYPSITTTFGHIPIILKGPCLQATVSATCQFLDPGQDPVNVSGIVDIDESTVTCQVPYLYSYGRIPLNLYVVSQAPSGGRVKEESYSGFIYSTEPSSFKLEVTYKDKSEKGQRSSTPYDPNRHQFLFKWDKIHFEKPGSENMYLELALLEFDTIWTDAELLSRQISNTGSFALNLSSLPKDYSNSTKVIKAFSLYAAPSAERRRRRRGFQKWVGEYIFSPFKYSKKHESSFYKKKCEAWHAAEPAPPSDVLNCPPTVEQVESDSRFEKDTISNIFSLDFFHPTADTSFRQRVPSPSGAGQQCVYKDAQVLINAPGGGTVDRISPNLSKERHFQEDVIPFFDCCLYSGEGEGYCQKYYYDKRPSDGGELYRAPRRARAVGDPHITTFDLTSYTFNGVGEFLMIKSTNFSMQARMEPFVASSTASIFTAFVMDDGKSRVQVQVSKGQSQGVDILLNGEVIIVDELQQGSLTLRSGSVTLSYGSPLTVTFSSGFSFAFSRAEISLSLISTAEEKNRGSVSGLLGDFDGVPENDLKNPAGQTFTAAASNLRQIHYDFGLKWMIRPEESLFVYSTGKSYETFSNPRFEPTFEMGDPEKVPPAVKTVCNGSVECLFDYQVTGSLTFANETAQQVELFEKIVLISSRVQGMCSPIQDFENGFIRVDNWFEGSVATFTCHEGYALQNGPGHVTCRAVNDDKYEWDSDLRPICVSQRAAAASTRDAPASVLILISSVKVFLVLNYLQR